MIKLEYDQIVLGYSPRAVLFSYRMGLPIILTQEDYRPIFFDTLPARFNLKFYKIEKYKKKLLTPSGDMFLTNTVEELYNKLLFIMSMASGTPTHGYCDSIHLFENKIKIKSKKNIEFEILFDKCHLFEVGKATTNLDILTKQQALNVYDYYMPTIKTKSNYDFIDLQNDKHKSAWFINPYKEGTASTDFTMVVHSELTKEEIDSGLYYPKLIDLTIRDYLSKMDAFYNDETEFVHDYRRLHDIHEFDIKNSESVIKNDLSFEEISKLKFKGSKYHNILEKLK